MIPLVLVAVGATAGSMVPAAGRTAPGAGAIAPRASAAQALSSVAQEGFSAAQEGVPAAQEGPPGGWIGPDGEPLPFRTHDDVVRYLEEAEVVSTESIPVGVTRPRKVGLRRDGVLSNGIFRVVDTVHEQVRLSNGEFRRRLIDRADHEVAAYRMARLLGLDNVPPAVERRIGNDRGSLQLWVENASRYEELYQEGVQAPGGAVAFKRRTQMMYLFDDLIGNDDRNRTNILIDDRERYWMIDHTRAFQIEYELQYVRGLIWVERTMWERLQSLDRETVERRIDSLISGRQLAALLERRDRILAEVRRLLSERGEAAVLFDWKAPEERAGAEERMTGREPSWR